MLLCHCVINYRAVIVPSVFVSVAYPDVTVCYVAILLYTCITVLKSYLYRKATGLDYWMLSCFFYRLSAWRVQIFAINLRNQISQLIFAALWTEKQAHVVVILVVKDSETQILHFFPADPQTAYIATY